MLLQAFAEVSDAVRADPYLSPHLRHYVREVRVVVYTQVLATLSTMPYTQLFGCDVLD